MPAAPPPRRRPVPAWVLPAILALALGWGACTTPPEQKPAQPSPPAPAPAPQEFLLGVEVLERSGFAAIKGKRVGLLTHAAAVNRRGVPSWKLLQAAAGVRLVALFSPEHGLDGAAAANESVSGGRHAASGLPLYSLYGSTRKPSAAMLRGLDALVVDLQDVGARTYTYISALRYAMEACFEAGVVVVVLDRPNPLGGMLVGGPPLDADLASYVGAYRIPYVYGLTIGELARWAQGTPGVLQLPERHRVTGQLVVVPMRGWRREMRWPDTGLPWAPTSPFVRDYASAVGYGLVGLGCELSGFSHGLGRAHAFRTLQFGRLPPEKLKAALDARRIPGLTFRVASLADDKGRPARTVYVEVSDWSALRPGDLAAHLLVLGPQLRGHNPYPKVKAERAKLFLKHLGSRPFWDALLRQGGRLDVGPYTDDWDRQARAFHAASRRFWLYPPAPAAPPPVISVKLPQG